ncbi:MAG: serine/threonine-protein phosphatase [Fimbriimonadaceae bacterium]|nr:serine/threonine-protein phosphatase [Fimbriimonadaceae bacterium]
MIVDVAGASHVGYKRKENQDGFLAETVRRAEGSPLVCLAIADGMGGHHAGKEASDRAIEAVRHNFPAFADLETLPEGCVRQIHDDAHARVAAIGNEGETVGTTLTVVLLRDGEAAIGHVGDSRAYLLRGGRLQRLTEDHTWDEYAHKHGIENPYGTELRQAVGVGVSVETETHHRPVLNGDRLLLCSDGLFKVVDDDAIRTVLRRAANAKAACDECVDRALKAGGPDNIAVVAAFIGRPRRFGCLPGARLFGALTQGVRG